MIVGVMTRMIHRPTLEQVADAIRGFGLDAIQLNLSSAGLPSLPEELGEERAHQIGDVFRTRSLVVAAVSGSFNAIHPDPTVRTAYIRRARLLVSRCRALGTSILTLCTGSRDPNNMWRSDRENSTPAAWQDLVATLRQLIPVAEDHGIMLAFEPEVVNVVGTVQKARQLIEELGSPSLRVVIDPANLVRPSDLPDTRPLLQEIFSTLGPHIALAHAKDVLPPTEGETECRRVPAFSGLLDYDYYVEQLVSSGFTGAIILHDLDERQIRGCRERLTGLLALKVS